MYRIIIISLLAIFLSIPEMNAQSGDRDLDVRVGIGISDFKKESESLVLSEYELNIKWTDYFTVAPSIVLNHNNNSFNSDFANFFQANLNAFGSPFRNDRRNEFRIGGGLSFYKLNGGTSSATKSSFGVNLILENRYMIKERFFIGIKAFIQPYLNKELNSGILLKAGINL